MTFLSVIFFIFAVPIWLFEHFVLLWILACLDVTLTILLLIIYFIYLLFGIFIMTRSHGVILKVIIKLLVPVFAVLTLYGIAFLGGIPIVVV